MAQEQKYTVVATRNGYEVRHYQTCVVAEVKVVGDFDTAGSSAFGSLFRFISGANGAGEKISMTAPVIQQPNESTRSQVWDEHIISFVMPADMTIADMPVPTDSQVQLREVSDQLVVALRFSGRMTTESYVAHKKRLEELMKRDGYIASDVARLARFNAPWTPGFMRRNEIQIPVVVATK